MLLVWTTRCVHEWESRYALVCFALNGSVAFSQVREHAGHWAGVLTAEDVHAVHDAVMALMEELRPDAVTIVDSFGFTDAQLLSAIGREVRTNGSLFAQLTFQHHRTCLLSFRFLGSFSCCFRGVRGWVVALPRLPRWLVVCSLTCCVLRTATCTRRCLRTPRPRPLTAPSSLSACGRGS